MVRARHRRCDRRRTWVPLGGRPHIVGAAKFEGHDGIMTVALPRLGVALAVQMPRSVSGHRIGFDLDPHALRYAAACAVRSIDRGTGRMLSTRLPDLPTREHAGLP